MATTTSPTPSQAAKNLSPIVKCAMRAVLMPQISAMTVASVMMVSSRTGSVAALVHPQPSNLASNLVNVSKATLCVHLVVTTTTALNAVVVVNCMTLR